MSNRPWYKRYGGDFVLGTMSLSLEEKGAYSLCLDLIYDRGGPIPDDARWLSGVCGVSLRKWSALRDRLLETGKLTAQDGRLSNARADKEIENAAETSRKHAENGSKGGDKSAEIRAKHNKNSDIEQARLKHNQKPEAREDTTPNGVAHEGLDSDPDAQAWSLAVQLLVSRAGLSERQARAFFGSLLKRHAARGSEMLVALIHAEDSGTQDLQPYLTAAAQSLRGLRIVQPRGPPSSGEAAVAAREEGRRRLLEQDDDGEPGRNYQRN